MEPRESEEFAQAMSEYAAADLQEAAEAEELVQAAGEYAPAAITWLGAQATAQLGAKVSGIIGDARHKTGYHRSRNWIMTYGRKGADYSIQLPEDRLGDGNAVSALDLSFPSSKMKVITAHLRRAALDQRDWRKRYLREFIGTLDGSRVYRRDVYKRRDDWGNRDRSHLWHIHLSFLRKYANDFEAMKWVLAIMKGETGPGRPKPQDLDE